MAHLIWTGELNTGIREIDTQHQRIVKFINDLHDARMAKDMTAVAEVIGEAVDYTLSHFAFEEELMQESGYRFAGPHKKVHELFTRKVSEFQSRFEAGEDISGELHAMLSRWLFNHIRNDDAGYADAVKTYMRQINGGQADKEELKDQIKIELMREMQERGKKKGWFARLFGR